MEQNTVYRLTVGGDNPRQYHLQSRWVVEIYIQTYRRMGKQVNLELLVDGAWQPVTI